MQSSLILDSFFAYSVIEYSIRLLEGSAMRENVFYPKVLLVLLLCAGTAIASAQSNEFMDDLLQQSGISVGQASYLVLVASENLSEDADVQRAFDLLDSLGWAPGRKGPDDPITVAEYAYMLTSAFGLKGGLMYSLFPSPRYAYRELRSKMIIQGRSDPGMKIDGTTAIRLLGRIFDILGVSYEM
jgi:hypothetical protein